MRGRVALLVFALAVGTAAAACGDDSGKTSTPSGSTTPALFSQLPSSIQRSKTIKVGSDIEYPPIEFFKEGTEQVQGVDYDIGQALGEKLGVTVKFINDTDFAGLITSMRAGRFDIIMSAMNDTKERQGKGADFIDYLRAGSGILVKKGNPKGIKGLDDLCGNTVAVQKGTVQETDILEPLKATCSAAGKSLTVLTFEKDSDAVQQVKNGRAVANLEDSPVAGYNAKTSGDGNDFEVVPGDVGDIGLYGIAVSHDAPELRDALQAALKAIIADGTYDSILANWGVTQNAYKKASINGGS
jgi:polar amino acid transport system substrate-binding protein